MKILVTGGGGFIGSHLVDLLLEQGHQVRVLDNFTTGRRANLPEANLALEIFTGDVRVTDDVAAAARGVEAIIHLAAVASVQASVEDPVGTHEVNLVGTVNLLEAARKNGIQRFVFASSAAVYGNTREIPVRESTPLAPLTPYAADKLASEYYIDFYRREHGIEAAVFRFFNIFGPRQDPSSPYSGVISIFMQNAIDGRTLTVFGDGCQSRDFVYVADLVALLAKAVSARQQSARAMNVGNGLQTSLNDLIGFIGALDGRDPAVVYAKARPGDIRQSCAANDLVVEQMGYRPAVTVEEGLARTYAWYRNPLKD